MICVISPKGGVGKTTVSTNLATGLAREAPGEVVIVDLDFQFGDVGSSLRMMPEHTFTDIVRTQMPLDILTLKVYLTPLRDGPVRIVRARSSRPTPTSSGRTT